MTFNKKISLIAYLVANGITIPHYCYHNELSVAGNCRVCLIELKNSIKPVVSCATNASSVLSNSKIYHDSALIKKARENILEFLLLNHPLDCPICDQGGDCDLQDQSLFFGVTKRRFYNFKRIVSDKNLGLIVKTVMTRCIHCTRCVRFATEIAGVHDLGVFGRGSLSEIGTYTTKIFSSELSGNVIDLCPVGALTLKNFPFELRGWEIHKFKSLDPTDNYLSSTLVYLNKNKIVQIEPCFNEYSNNWLSDKARHYFDTIFATFSENKKIKIKWLKLYNQILKKIYISEHCRKQTNRNYLFTIVFDYLNIELLAMLSFISQSYSFVSLRQIQSSNNLNTDLESNFQVNNLLHKKSLITSNLCLLLATNPRYEGHSLNLNLRQRVLKKNFKCILIGSLINLTFPVSFLGTNTNIIKGIAEGNNLICQNLKYSINPILICNTELWKRNDSRIMDQIFKIFFYHDSFSKAWCGINILSSSINEVGVFISNQTKKLKLKDLNNFSSIYLLNANISKIGSFKKITELQLFQKEIFGSKGSEKKFIFDQNYKKENNLQLSIKTMTDYFYIPTTTFYENEETFINTIGYIKKTTKIISKNKSKNTWQILRKIIRYLKNKLIFLNKKSNQTLFFNLNKLYKFKNYTNFQHYPVKKITNLAYYLSTKNKIFTINKFNFYFRITSKKLMATKLKYWLNDFFNSSKDQYSTNSNILIGCSKQMKHQATNFF